MSGRRYAEPNQGAFRTGDYEEIMNKVSALAVLSKCRYILPLVLVPKPARP